MHIGNKIIGVTDKRLQLLSEESGVFRPCVLTTMVGSSSAGRTTHLDVLAGRKTGGCIEGDIKISGHKNKELLPR
jgi:predicted ABC-type transport system involved in lysophospholipase L1 biosynthesis ATPase subunit